MMKKLAVPALMLAMAAFGCSSSTTSSGTGGSGGHATGGSATGGSHVGGSGGGGTSGGGTAGGGTSGGGTAGGGHAGGGTAGGGTAGGGHAGGGTAGGGTAGGGHAGGGTSGGGTAGGGTAGGGTSGGGAGGSGIQAMPNCTTTDPTAGNPLSAEVFCMNLLANCASPPVDYATVDACKMAYGMGSTGRQHCQSYHLCWGVEGQGPAGGGNPAMHCPHAEAMSICTTAAYP